MEPPKLKCKKCGAEVRLNELQLDPDTRELICDQCFRLRSKAKEVKQEGESKPKDWDADDKYLEQAAKEKAREKAMQPQPRFERYEGTNEGMYTCSKCKYQFKYNLRDMKPKNCPYCGTKVMEIF